MKRKTFKTPKKQNCPEAMLNMSARNGNTPKDDLVKEMSSFPVSWARTINYAEIHHLVAFT